MGLGFRAKGGSPTYILTALELLRLRVEQVCGPGWLAGGGQGGAAKTVGGRSARTVRRAARRVVKMSG